MTPDHSHPQPIDPRSFTPRTSLPPDRSLPGLRTVDSLGCLPSGLFTPWAVYIQDSSLTGPFTFRTVHSQGRLHSGPFTPWAVYLQDRSLPRPFTFRTVHSLGRLHSGLFTPKAVYIQDRSLPRPFTFRTVHSLGRLPSGPFIPGTVLPFDLSLPRNLDPTTVVRPHPLPVRQGPPPPHYTHTHTSPNPPHAGQFTQCWVERSKANCPVGQRSWTLFTFLLVLDHHLLKTIGPQSRLIPAAAAAAAR